MNVRSVSVYLPVEIVDVWLLSFHPDEVYLRYLKLNNPFYEQHHFKNALNILVPVFLSKRPEGSKYLFLVYVSVGLDEFKKSW